MHKFKESVTSRLKYSIVLEICSAKLFVLGGLIYLVSLNGCASPGAPTGGPKDEKAPAIRATYPETGTTNFEGSEIVFEFSEFVDRESVNSALRIEPDLGIEYQLDWGRKSVAVEFQRKLPDNVTVVLTLGTDLVDLRGNSISQPKKVAVSTGDRIDDGRLVARIRNADDGSPGYRNRIFLIDTTRALTAKADYIGEADTAGVVDIGYLSSGTYRVMWVQDINRNRKWEAEREKAQPFRKKYVDIEQGEADSLSTLFINEQDTSRARLQAVGVFSQQRLRLRFSEEIVMQPKTDFSLLDSNGTRLASMYPLYKQKEQKNVLFGYLEENLQGETNYQLRAERIEDLAGNITKDQSIEFTGSSQSDTTLQRLIKIQPDHPVLFNDTLSAIYAAPIVDEAITDSLTIVENRERIKWDRYEVQQNKLRVMPDSLWSSETSYQVRFWQPQSNDYELHELQVWDSTSVGALNISMSDSLEVAAIDTINKDSQLIADLTDREYGEFNQKSTFKDSVVIEGIPPVQYRLKVFRDANGDGEWNPGSVDPYKKPELLFIQNRVPVSGNMTSDVRVNWE